MISFSSESFRPMRVLLFSTSYPADITDWRGVFMRHLAMALARHHDIQLSVWAPPGELPATAASITTPREMAWLKRLMAAGGVSHLMRSGGIRSLPTPLILLRMIAAAYRRHDAVDVYHVNWLQCALPLPRNDKPALITVLGNDLKLLRLPFMRAFLRRTMRGRKVAICPNAEWMHDTLQAAFGDIAEVIPVPFGIDPSWFSIQRKFGEQPTKRWLAVTRLTADKLGPLFEWSQDFFCQNDRELHLFGPMQENIAVPDWVHYHGAATPEQLAKDWFPHACGLITLSRHAEGRPQVMLEAMGAALPVVASCTDAHSSIVENGLTGLLCDSVETYVNALLQLEDPGTNENFGAAARAWAACEIGTWDDCAQRYRHIYQGLLGNNNIE